MTYIKEDKYKGIKEDYIPDWQNDINTNPVIFEKVPGINDTQIDQSISIDT